VFKQAFRYLDDALRHEPGYVNKLDYRERPSQILFLLVTQIQRLEAIANRKLAAFNCQLTGKETA
jgi:hypothetical protein